MHYGIIVINPAVFRHNDDNTFAAVNAFLYLFGKIVSAIDVVFVKPYTHSGFLSTCLIVLVRFSFIMLKLINISMLFLIIPFILIRDY